MPSLALLTTETTYYEIVLEKSKNNTPEAKKMFK